ncbi:hypothetical protein TNCV_2649501 [Trichonephila clavipes]|nr:hypothetical protein TNCV_2649501 [Trichonephila clavipes]
MAVSSRPILTLSSSELSFASLPTRIAPTQKESIISKHLFLAMQRAIKISRDPSGEHLLPSPNGVPVLLQAPDWDSFPIIRALSKNVGSFVCLIHSELTPNIE